ncbi:hypothetical protein PFISCL1PPCAC_470, partial [Pristionchus fissidentatus]
LPGAFPLPVTPSHAKTMAEGNGGRPLSYLERMKRLKEQNDRKRAHQFGSEYAKASSSTSSVPATAAAAAAATGEEKENAGNCSNYDASLLQESQLRANKSAPAGDVSSLGASMMTSSSSIMEGREGVEGGGGDVLQRSTFSLLGDSSSVASSNVSKNTSAGSSVIDMPRETAANGHNSILHSFTKLEDQPNKESFSRPAAPTRSRTDSENAGGRKKGEADETFEIQPPPTHAPAHYGSQQHHHSILQQSLLHDRPGRSGAANGSILRSKSAASTFEPVFATPAMSRSSAILSGLSRTPGYCQTPSMLNRLSISALSLASANRLIVKDKEYAVLSQIGKGGSSQVFQAFDDETGATVAIKIVDLSDTDDASREAFVNEVQLLQQLQGSRHVITMFDYELSADEEQLLVVMEKGETDLATYLKTRRNEITPTFLRYWWEEMLHAVEFVHKHNVVHMDLKPANFLLVSGNLKLIDFGIASSIPSNKTSVIKDTQMGTLSYMSPESLLASERDEEEGEGASKFKVTAKSDVWSLGCILYTLVYGRRPFDQFKQVKAKMRAITDPDTPVHYDKTDDPMLVDVLKRCLVYDVKKRASVAELLDHPYLRAPISSSSTSSSAAHAVSTPTRPSPISDQALEQLAIKMQSYTPRTVTRELRRIVNVAQSKSSGGTGPLKKPVLELDSPPSTK